MATVESRWRLFRNEGRTPQGVASRGEAGGKPQPWGMGKGRYNHTVVLHGSRTRGAILLADSDHDLQVGRYQLPGDFPGGGPV